MEFLIHAVKLLESDIMRLKIKLREIDATQKHQS